MNGVIGMTQLLLDTPLDASQKQYAATIQASAESLLTVINDILDFSKIEAGHLHVESVAFDLPATVGGALDTVAPKAAEKGLSLAGRLPSDLPCWLMGDATRLRQILLNLLGNAIKFTQHGEVSLSVEMQTRQADHLQLRFTVKDTGIGIPADKLGELFSPFMQADTSITRRFGGTGLGLSISRRLVELLGGSIGVESMEGQGSRFWFDLPFTLAVAPGEAVDAGILPAPASRSAHILLVEDNAINQRVALAMLERNGHRVDVAADGRAALDKLARTDYDLVLMDCQMPEMDGFEATRHIRANDPAVLNAKIPIVAMTANAMAGDRERCLAAGMDDYISKPVHDGDLRRVIDGMLTDRPAAAEPARSMPRVHGQTAFCKASLLAHLGGDVGLACLLVEGLLTDLPACMKRLAAAVESKDWSTAAREAHTLKGLAASGGALQLCDAALQVELVCKGGNESETTARIAPLRACLDEVMPQWRAFIEAQAA